MSSLPDKIKLRIWPGGSWQLNGTDWVYHSEFPVMRVMVPTNITHSKFVRCVQSRCGFDPNFGTTKIVYQFSGQIYELRDTDDVQAFMESATAVRNPPTLCVYIELADTNNVGGCSNSVREPDVVGGSNTVREPDVSPVEQSQAYVPHFQSEDEHVYGYNHDFLSPVNYGYSDYNPEIVPETQEPVEEPHEEDDDESHVYRLDIPGLNLNEEDDEEDGEEDEEEETSPIKSYGGINDFFGQPPPLPDRDDHFITQEPIAYNRSNLVNEGDFFATKDDLTLALGKKFVEEVSSIMVTVAVAVVMVVTVAVVTVAVVMVVMEVEKTYIYI